MLDAQCVMDKLLIIILPFTFHTHRCSDCLL